MTLDEAIIHCHEKAKELRELPFKEKMDIEDIADCEECASEHEQLAGWLKDYKRLLEEQRSQGEWIFKHGSSDVWCSVCDISLESNLCEGIKFRFCPNCGADMRKGEEE